MPKLLCPQCKRPIEIERPVEGAITCPHCGVTLRLKKKKTPPSSIKPQTPLPTTPAPQNSPQQRYCPTCQRMITINDSTSGSFTCIYCGALLSDQSHEKRQPQESAEQVQVQKLWCSTCQAFRIAGNQGIRLGSCLYCGSPLQARRQPSPRPQNMQTENEHMRSSQFLHTHDVDDPSESPPPPSPPTSRFFHWKKTVMYIGIVMGLLLVIIAGVMRALNGSKGDSLRITFHEQEAEITKGPHRFFMAASPEFTIDLRVYGYNDNTFSTGKGPDSTAAIMTHIFIATSLETNRKIFEQYLCEQKAAEQASLLHVLAATPQITQKIQELRQSQNTRRCARITGKNLRIKQYFYHDNDYTGDIQWFLSENINFDPDNLLFITDIEAVSCSTQEVISSPTPIETYTIISGKRVSLRDTPRTVSSDEARTVFKLSYTMRPLMYIKNEFEDLGEVVMDHATKLMWQKSGSEHDTPYQDAQVYIEKLNHERFAGYNDWRLPTIPELMSLLEPERQSNNYYINPIFDRRQLSCWSADTTGSSGPAWFVEFVFGYVDLYDSNPHSFYVRAVRSWQ